MVFSLTERVGELKSTVITRTYNELGENKRGISSILSMEFFSVLIFASPLKGTEKQNGKSFSFIIAKLFVLQGVCENGRDCTFVELAKAFLKVNESCYRELLTLGISLNE